MQDEKETVAFLSAATTDARIFLGMCSVLQAAAATGAEIVVEYTKDGDGRNIASGVGFPAEAYG
ncbi:MAG: hypothetical protein JSS20_18315 [Proteobacteria bacterium]|nr:hypothetical protein [Pseudomonadota bacterium]